MSAGIWTEAQAWAMTAEQAATIARRQYDGAFDGSIGAGLAHDGGLSFTATDWSIADAALTDDHGPIDGCACELAGMLCDLNALRNYCKHAGEMARQVEQITNGDEA